MICGHFAPLIASYLQSGVSLHYDPPARASGASLIDDPVCVALSSLRNQWNTSLAATARNAPFREFQFRCATPCMNVDEVREQIEDKYLPLYAIAEPGIALADYAQQLVGGLRCGAECFIMALCLIDTVSTVLPVCNLSLHRMLLTAAVVCAKSRDDWYLSMSYYAEVGGVSTADLLAMEVALLDALGFLVHVPISSYVSLIHSLHCHAESLSSVHQACGRWQSVLAFIPIPLPEMLKRELEAEKPKSVLLIESQTSYETLDDLMPEIEALHSSLHSITSIGELRQSSLQSSIGGACVSELSKSPPFENKVRDKAVL